MNSDDTNNPIFVPDLTSLQAAGSLAVLFDIAFDAVVLLDPQERIIYWNPIAEQLYGWSSVEVIGKTPSELFWPTKTPQEEKRKRQRQWRLGRGEILRGTDDLRRKDGSSIWVQYVTRAILEANGALAGYIARYRDIAVQPRESVTEDYFAKVFRDSPDAVVITRLSDGMILEVNGCWQQMFGYEEQEALGQTSLELKLFAHETDRVNLIRLLQQHGTLDDHRVDIRHKSGEVRHVSLSVKKIEIDGLGCLLSVLRDTTEHTEEEQQVRKSAALDAFRVALMDALRHLRDPIQIQTAAMRVVGEHLKVDRVLYAVIDEDTDTAFIHDNYVRGTLPKLVGKFRLSEFGHAYEVLRSGEKLVLSDTTIYPDLATLHPQSFTDWGVYSLVSVPLIKEGRFVANLSVQHGSIRNWNDSEVAFLEEIAEYIWAAVERAQVERALHASQERYRSIVENANEGIWEIDQNLRTVFVNGYITNLLGYTAEEMKGHAIFDFLPLEDQAEAVIRTESEKQGTVQHGMELRLRRKDGSIVWVMLSTTPGFDEQGNFVGILGMFTDITRRKQAEDQLERNNRQLNEILTSIKEDLYVLDRNWNFVFISRLFTSKLGKEPDYFVGKNIWEMFPKHLSSPLGESFRKAMETGEMQSLEVEGQYSDAWYRVAIFPSADGITVLGTDISERKQLELQLKESNRRLNEILDSIQDDFYVLNHQWKFVFVSRLFASRIGKKPEDFVGNSLWEMFPKHIGTPFEGYLRAAMEKGEKQTFVIPGQYTNAWYRLTAFPSEEGITVLGTDVTQRIQAEEEARKSYQLAEHENLQLRALLEHLPVGVMVTDPTGRVLLMNPTMDRIWRGKRPLESLPEYSSYLAWRTDTGELIGPEDWPVSIALRTGSAEPTTEIKIQRFDGTFGIILTAAVPIRDHNGQIIRAVAVAQDITELKQVEAALEQAEQQYSTLFNTITEGFAHYKAIYSEQGQLYDILVEEINPAGATISGVSREDQIGKTWRQVWPGVSDDLFVQYDHVDKTGETLRFNDHNQMTGRIYEVLISRIKPGNFAVTFTDVTERKRDEQALQDSQKQLQVLNETLEIQVQNKTEEARRLAADLIEATQNERQRISHILHDDLQQRIYAVRMQLSVLQSLLNLENEAAHRETSTIEKQMTDILQVIRHLSIELSPPILRQDGLTRAINWLTGQMQQQHNLAIELQANDPVVLANEKLYIFLFNCVRELLFNVVKHAQASQALVVLYRSETNLTVEVQDNGKGFPIYQPENPSSFGLPTMRHQLSLFDGHMQVDSNPGTGTRIILSLPISEPAEQS